ncbi:hypothetical protein JW935_15650 [candidate division KSB1 bacterium]|nr:hypothetical protein [candidate division KSB1 bacterium]
MDLVKMTSPCGRDCFNCPIFLSKDDPRKVFNLCLIKKMGLEKWAETKANKVFETYFKEKLKI